LTRLLRFFSCSLVHGYWSQQSALKHFERHPAMMANYAGTILIIAAVALFALVSYLANDNDLL